MNSRRIVSLFALGLLATALPFSDVAVASPISDSYTIAAENFPVDIAAGGVMTFNAAGDLTPEVVPGSGDSLLVVEQFFAGGGASGGDLLAFQFSFTQYPAGLDDPFGFLIGDIDWPIPGVNTLVSATLAVDFGVSALAQTDVTALTAAFDLDGLYLLFQAPVTWSEVYALTNPPAGVGPSQIVTTFLAEIRHTAVPEPSSVYLLIAGALGFLGIRRLWGFPPEQVVPRKSLGLSSSDLGRVL